MSTEMVVRFCSPTLAGLKVGSLFSCKFQDQEQLRQIVLHHNQMLNKKGVYIEILRIRQDTTLIYVYRKSKLQQLFQNKDIRKFLKEYDYLDFNIENCIEVLKIHLLGENFPHEIGIFLGYPLGDVKGFIKSPRVGCKYVGHWKVYSNEEWARKTFCEFDKCTNIYCEKFRQGTEITKLAIAI